MKVPVKNLSNRKVREIELPDEIFGVPFREHLVHLVAEANRAARRRGTHSTKNRAEVRGSGVKPWRQKGTGRARAGSVRSPLWRKGGTVHGPRPRSHEKGVSAREKRLALKAALSQKLRDEGMTVIDNLDIGSPKTRELVGQLAKLKLEGKVLLVDSQENENLYLASRNDPRLKAVDALGLQVYDVMARPHLLISEAAVERLVEVLTR